MERRLVAILAADVAGFPGRGGGRTPRITGPGFGWGLSCALKAKILRKPSGYLPVNPCDLERDFKSIGITSSIEELTAV